MRLKFLKSVAALLSLGILMTGCTSDELMPENEKPIERDSKFYVNVSIASADLQATRAEGDGDVASDYHNGTADEQKIYSILFVFYNSSNKYVGNTVVTLVGNDYKVGDEVIGNVNDNKTDLSDNGDGTVSTLLNVLVPVNVAAGSLKPAYVMAYVNPTTTGVGTSGVADDLKRGLEPSLGLLRSLSQVTHRPTGDNDHSGFTMSNSVYYDYEDGSDRPVIATKIPEGSLFDENDIKDETKADKINEGKINIYVERVVAKVLVNKVGGDNFKQEDNTVELITDATKEYELDFNILGWGLSNLEKKTFLVKNFRNTTADITENVYNLINMSQTEVQSLLDGDLKDASGVSNWNFPSSSLTTGNWKIAGHRSFWGLSPTYYGGKYPAFSDQIKTETDKANYSLTYRSFNDIYDTDANRMGTYGAGMNESQYSLEHTMDASVVTEQQKRGVTCALVLGQYSIKEVGSEEDAKTQTFFILNGIKNNGKEGNWIYPDEDALKSRILSTSVNNRLYKNAGTDEKPDYQPITWESMTTAEKAYFKIDHPDKSITDNRYTPNRFVSLQIANEANVKDAKFYLKTAEGDYKLISSETGANNATIAATNRALYGLMNGVEKYHNGYAFFAVPIEHLWVNNNKDKDGNVKRIGDNGFTAQTGQYGVVRNHFYTINVTGIKGIGTGIGNPKVPIIPNVDEEKYYVKTEIHVQRWRVVPAQNVVLRP